MYRNITLAVLLSTSLALLNSGCGDPKNKKDREELRSALQKQAEEITAVNKKLETNSNEIKQLNELVTSRKNEDSRKRLVEAASLLAKEGPERTSSQAISILGSIGGPDAEEAIVELLETGYNHRALLDALSKINSKKATEVIIAFLNDGDEQQVNAAIEILQNSSARRSIKLNEDMLEKLLEKYPDGDHNNSRYYRNIIIGTIFRMNQEKGIDIICRELMTANQSDRKRELIYQICNNNSSVKFENVKRIMNALGEIDSRNPEIIQALLQMISRSGDWRLTDTVLAWSEISLNNNNLTGTYIETLARLNDPKAAKSFLELCQSKNTSRRGGNYSYYLDKYPGIEKDENGNYRLVDEDKMAKLLKEREERLKKLDELEKVKKKD